MDKITIVFSIKGNEFKNEVEIESNQFTYAFEEMIEKCRLNTFGQIIDTLSENANSKTENSV